MPFFKKGQLSDESQVDDTFDDYEDTAAPMQSSPAPSLGGLGGTQQNCSIQLKVVRPEKFEDVLTAADHLIAGRTVVIDFEDTNRDTVKRVKDFLGGVTYSINGQLQKIANNTYIATPNNVGVSEDRAKRPSRMNSSVNIDDIDNM
ncbi:MAG: cell division protein SepF [Eubacteriales bacterium]|nr:cell division protein SepF [Eubacteriales bacterium]